MGVTYYSEAIIFTTKPEKIRDLIGQIYNLEPNKNGYHTLKPDADYAASTLCNLKVEENTIHHESRLNRLTPTKSLEAKGDLTSRSHFCKQIYPQLSKNELP